MTLDDLLQELRENILHDRSDRTAGSSDYLWSDTTLIRYIDEAQRRFARRSLVIRDGATPQCTVVPVVNGTNKYPLDPSVIAVVSARYSTDVADLARAGHSAFDTYRRPDTQFFDLSLLTTLPPGKPLAFATDEFMSNDTSGSAGVMTLRLFPIPAAPFGGVNVNLRVCRMPLKRLTLKEKDVIPEIPEEYHLDMLDWAAYLALRIEDVDAGMRADADKFAQTFEVHVQEARQEVLRKMFTPLEWGFGRNGFAWSGNDG